MFGLSWKAESESREMHAAIVAEMYSIEIESEQNIHES
jgi:hypothetical protein